MNILKIFDACISENTLPKGVIFDNSYESFDKIKQKLALSLLCEQQLGCGVCRGCMLYAEDNHPDLITIQPNDSIKVVREHLAKLRFSPKYALKYLFICNEVDKLSATTLQTFLIPLEESGNSIFIFNCLENINNLPKPLVSRCFVIQDVNLNFDTDRYKSLYEQLKLFIDGKQFTWFELKKFNNPSLYVVLYLLMGIVKEKFDESLLSNDPKNKFWGKFYQELVKMVKNLHQNPNINPGITVQRLWIMIQMTANKA